jgi:hypothetical protein
MDDEAEDGDDDEKMEHEHPAEANGKNGHNGDLRVGNNSHNVGDHTRTTRTNGAHHKKKSKKTKEDFADEEEEEDKDLKFARERKHVRGLVLEGNSVEASKIVHERWPTIMDTPIGLELRVQCLVELISESKYTDAVQHARSQLWPYISLPSMNSELAKMVKEALGLFAIPNPRDSFAKTKGSIPPTSKLALLAPERRRLVADNLNRALLFHPKPPKSPALDRILMGLAECAAIARAKAGGYGAEFKYEANTAT